MKNGRLRRQYHPPPLPTPSPVSLFLHFIPDEAQQEKKARPMISNGIGYGPFHWWRKMDRTVTGSYNRKENQLGIGGRYKSSIVGLF